MEIPRTTHGPGHGFTGTAMRCGDLDSRGTVAGYTAGTQLRLIEMDRNADRVRRFVALAGKSIICIPARAVTRDRVATVIRSR